MSNIKETITAILIVLVLLVLGNTGPTGPTEIDWNNVHFTYEDATTVAESLK